MRVSPAGRIAAAQQLVALFVCLNNAGLQLQLNSEYCATVQQIRNAVMPLGPLGAGSADFWRHVHATKTRQPN
jgi:hypothetical protein